MRYWTPAEAVAALAPQFSSAHVSPLGVLIPPSYGAGWLNRAPRALAHLARLEARVAFEELLVRIPDYRLAEPPMWRSSIWARAHPAVRIEFEPE